MTRVGVISDTHGKLLPAAYAAMADCDFIIHAGDICGRSILRELETLAPVYAVLGNNDAAEYGEHVSRWARPVIDGVRFLVAHYPEDVQVSKFGSSVLAPGDPIPKVCIHGHTHVPKLEVGKAASPADILMCPGSASRGLWGSPKAVGFVEVSCGSVLEVCVQDLKGKTLLQWRADES